MTIGGVAPGVFVGVRLGFGGGTALLRRLGGGRRRRRSVRRHDALDEASTGARAAGDEDLAVEAGRGGGDVRKGGEAGEQGSPVADAVGGDAHQVDVGGGAEEAVLQVALHAVGDGEGDDERGDPSGDAQDGDGSDDADDGLSALGAEVARGDEELKPHAASLPIGVARSSLVGKDGAVADLVFADLGDGFVGLVHGETLRDGVDVVARGDVEHLAQVVGAAGGAAGHGALAPDEREDGQG